MASPHDSTEPSESEPARSPKLIPAATIADQVAEEVLRAIDSGEYAPGQVLSDVELAATFGVSRAPVRDALQRLRVYRVIETSASRYTRVTNPGIRALSESRVVWVALLGALLDTIATTRPDALVTELEQRVERFHTAIAHADDDASMAEVFAYFRAAMSYSDNHTLLEALNAYLHQFGLAVRAVAGTGNVSRALTALFGVDGERSFLRELLDGLRDRDLTACHTALSRIGAQEPSLPFRDPESQRPASARRPG